MPRNSKVADRSVALGIAVLAAALMGCQPTTGAQTGPQTGASQAAPSPASRWLPFLGPRTVRVSYEGPIPVELRLALDSQQLRNGDRFEAVLARDLRASERLVARAGSAVTGQVVEAVESGRVKGVAQLTLALESITIGGRSYPIASNNRTFVADDSHGKDAAIIGGAGAAGALIGAIAKGGKGAAVGAATGAAAGTGVVLGTRGKPVRLAAGYRLDFDLQRPLELEVPRQEPAAGDNNQGDGARPPR